MALFVERPNPGVTIAMVNSLLCEGHGGTGGFELSAGMLLVRF